MATKAGSGKRIPPNMLDVTKYPKKKKKPSGATRLAAMAPKGMGAAKPMKTPRKKKVMY